MEDKVLTERDIHRIVKILQTDSNIILNKNVLCGALGLTIGEREEIASRVDKDRAGNYDYLSLVLNKWIGLNSGRATVRELAKILRDENFISTADEVLRTLESLASKENLVTKTGMCDQLKGVKLEDTEQTGSDGAKEIIEIKGSQIEFDGFLGMGPKNLNRLKIIQFSNVEMNWIEFWDSVDLIKTLESVELTNMRILRFNPARRKILPNMKKYVLKLEKKSSEDVMGVLKQSGEVKYPVEYLIPFAKGNLVEDIWSTCLSLKYIRLDLVISYENVTFLIDKDNFEFEVERVFVEHQQNMNSIQSSILPKFFQSFQGLKKLTLTNWRGIVGYLDFSSFPSSLTHLLLFDSVTSIRDGDLDVALKTCRELIYLNVSDPTLSTTKHTLDIANLSPKIRYLRLENTSITSSSPCQFKNLSVLCLIGSHFQSSVNVPFIFRNVKKCCFRGSGRSTDPPFKELKNWLEMDSLELIVIWWLEIGKSDGVGEILKSCGVPLNSNSFALDRNSKKQWQLFVSDGEKNPWEFFCQALTHAWNYTVK